MALPVSDDFGKTLSDAWDYKGLPANRSKTGGWIPSAMILGVETCERLITLGIAFNLVTYLTGVMHLGNATSANTVTNFLGTSFMLCLLGGFIADTFLGRYLTIAIFATVQALGVTILTISTIIPNLRPPRCVENSTTCIQANGTQLGVLHLALYLTALGTGGLKSSVSGFGSDQFDDKDKDERTMMTRFFNWFYFIVSFGSLAAVTVLVYIEDNLGRQWGYGICACAVVVCLIVFLLGTKRYRFKKLSGSPLSQIAAVFVAAWKKRKMELPADPSQLFNIDELSETSVKSKQKLPHSKQFRFLDKASLTTPEMGENLATVSKWDLATLTDVEEVKMIVRMLPIWATTIEFWTIHAQMTTFSVSQAVTMDRHIGSKFEIPPASMTAFLIASILLTVPIYDRLVAPIAARLFKNPQGLTPLRRVGVGLFFATIAMVVAALTEIKRLRVAESHGLEHDPNAVLPISVFWLIPQFILTGAGEAMIYAGQLDFFLRECPKGMKTMSTGLFLSTLSLGFFFSTIIVSLVNTLTAVRKKSSIYSHTIQRLASARKFTLIEEILEEHKKYKDITDEGFTVRLITLYGKSNMFDHAHKLFDEMTQLKCERTVLSFNALLGACVSSKNFDKVDGFFRELPGKLGIKPDVVSYNTVIKSLCETGSLDAAVSLHDEMVKEGLKPDVVTFNILFDAFYKSRFLDGEKLWVRMGEFNVAPDVMSCNSRLYGLVSENKIQEAVDFVEEILSKGLELDVYTYSILFKGFCRDEKYIGEAKRWFDKMMRTKCPPNRSIFSVLLRYACNCNDFHFASRLCRALFYRHCRLSEGQGELLQKVVDGLVKQLNIKEAELLVKLGKGSKYSCYHSLKMPKFDN